MRFVLDTDGTPEGTTIKLDGRSVTDEEDVEDVSFFSHVGWSYEEDTEPGMVSFNFTTREYNEEDGGVERMTYSWRSGENSVDKRAGVLGRSKETEDNYIPDDKRDKVVDSLGDKKRIVIDLGRMSASHSASFMKGLTDLLVEHGVAKVKDAGS